MSVHYDVRRASSCSSFIFGKDFFYSSHGRSLSSLSGRQTTFTMIMTRTQVRAIIALCFYFSVAFADSKDVYIERRDGSRTPSITTEPLQTQSSSPTHPGGSSSGSTEDFSTSQPPSASSSAKPSPNLSTSSSLTPSLATLISSVSISAVTSNINGAAPTSAIRTSVFNGNNICFP